MHHFIDNVALSITLLLGRKYFAFLVSGLPVDRCQMLPGCPRPSPGDMPSPPTTLPPDISVTMETQQSIHFHHNYLFLFKKHFEQCVHGKSIFMQLYGFFSYDTDIWTRIIL